MTAHRLCRCVLQWRLYTDGVKYMELWRKNLYWLVAIQILAGSAILGVISFIPLFVHDLGVTDAGAASMWAGLVTGVTAFTAAFSNPYWGAYGDRKGHKRVLLQILLFLTAVMCAMSLVRSPFQLFVLRAVQGAVGGFIAAGLTMVVTQTPQKHEAYAIGTYQTGIVLGATLGPLIGGGIADIIGYRETFLFFGCLTLLGFFLAKRYLYEDFKPVPNKPKESVWQNFKLFFRLPLVRLMMICQFFVNFALTGLGPILPLYIKEMAGPVPALATLSGGILAIGGLAGAVSAMNMGRIAQSWSHRQIMLAGTFFGGLFFIAQHFAPDVYLLGLFRFLNGLCIGTLMPSANTIISREVPEEKRGIAFGVTSGTALMGNVAGPIASGLIALTFDMGAVFWSTAAVFFFICYLIYRSLPATAGYGSR